MPEVICNTSPLQYLHQLGELHLLRALAGQVIVPPTEVLALALEATDAVAILDDRLARQVAQTLGIRITGTLGVLLEAKRADLIPAVGPLMDRLQALGFRLSPTTRAAVLRLSGEAV